MVVGCVVRPEAALRKKRDFSADAAKAEKTRTLTPEADIVKGRAIALVCVKEKEGRAKCTDGRSDANWGALVRCGYRGD